MDLNLTSEIPADLIAAYLAAHYSFEFDTAHVAVRIGEPCPVLARLMEEFGSPSACYITAYSPRGKQVSTEQNETWTRLLRDALPSDPKRVLPATGEDPNGQVAPEPGFMVLGLTRKDAQMLGERFGQNAIVWIATDGVPELLLLR